MYVCMYVCIYVGRYVCMYVCMYVFMYVCIRDSANLKVGFLDITSTFTFSKKSHVSV